MSSRARYSTSNFIFYGTLRDPDILQLVAGSEIRKRYWQSTEIADFDLVFVEGEAYPGVRSRAQASFVADLYVDLNQTEIQAIMDYEGDEYQLATWPLLGREFHIFLPRQSTRLTDAAWDLQNFQISLKSDYLRYFSSDDDKSE